MIGLINILIFFSRVSNNTNFEFETQIVYKNNNSFEIKHQNLKNIQSHENIS